MRPPGPEPITLPRSMPFSLAKRLASGDAFARPEPLAAPVAAFASGAAGASFGAAAATIAGAAAKTGLDSGVLGQIVEQIGGEGSLGEFARILKDNPQASGLLGMLDRDGDGNPLDDIAGMAKGLFGKS